MKSVSFPALIQSLPNFNGHFNAFQLEAANARVLFAFYSKGQVITPHTHESENVGIVTKGTLFLEKDGKEDRYPVGTWYHLDRMQIHAARFDEDTEIIEIWFERNQ